MRGAKRLVNVIGGAERNAARRVFPAQSKGGAAVDRAVLTRLEVQEVIYCH